MMFRAFASAASLVTVLLLAGLLLQIARVDRRTGRIPDLYPLLMVMLAVVGMGTMPYISPVSRLLGAVCGGLPLLFLCLLRPGAFGGGDIKLMAAGGLVVGASATLMALVLGFFIGGVQSVYWLARGKANRKSRFAFGPSLCAGLLIAVLLL